MIILSKRIAQILSIAVFLLLTIVGIFSKSEFYLGHLPIILLKAFIGYVIFWLLGIVVADIVLKSIVSSVENEKIEKWEGGLMSAFAKEKNDEYLDAFSAKKKE